MSITKTEPAPRTTDQALERRWSTVEAKLAAYADLLADQGGLVAMRSASGRRVWVVRVADVVGERRVHRSLYVGGDQPELLGRVRNWLDRCRVDGRVAREVEGYAEVAAAACAVVRRLRPNIAATRRRGGGGTPV